MTTMEPDQLERIRALYESALEREPEDREEFLAEACAGDHALREKVSALLSARAEASEMFAEPAWKSFVSSGSSAGDDPPEPDTEPGLPFEHLGPFRLVRRLGEGGMGVVYLGVQEPLGRQVALKILRPDRAGSFEAEKRFWREIKTVSRLRHPNIVTVYDSGEEHDVRYFAMELVSGRDLDEVLTEASSRGERIATSRALAWAREIARALSCAHEAGVVHRDVKPSNIRIDTEGRVKLMDFGVARHLNLSKMTLTGDFRGTPNYAAPEQVDSKTHPVDARTDVHALGVTLYEIVTGRVPFAGETTAQTFRQILSKDPTPPRRLNSTISRDLETVILTALEKEPGRRYQTMSDFADDIDRLLQGEMIHAKPGGAVTRLWKRARRNPTLSAALGFSSLAASALILSIPWYIAQITTERDEAETEAKKANTANEFLESMFSSPEPGVDGREVKVVDVLEKAIAGIATDFTDEPEIEAFLRRTIGRTYYRLGLYEEGEEQLDLALETRTRVLGAEHPDTLTSMNDLGLVLRMQGQLFEAEQLYRQALSIQLPTLGKEHPDTLITLNNIANVLRSQKKILQAEPIYEEVLEIRRRVLGEEDPDTLTSRSNLTSVLIANGMLAEAERLQREVLEIRKRVMGDEHPDTITSMNNLGIVLLKRRSYSDAESLFRASLEIHQRLLGDEHSDTLRVMDNLAGLLKETGGLEEAETLCRQVMETKRARSGETHAHTRIAIGQLADVLRLQNRFAEAEDLCLEALDTRCQILGDVHPETCRAMDGLVQLYMNIGKLIEAEELCREILELWCQQGKGEGVPGLRSRMRLGRVLMMRGEFAAAEVVLSEELEIAERTRPEGDQFILSSHGHYGECLGRLRRFEKAQVHLQAAYDGLKSSRGEDDLELRIVLGHLNEVRQALGESDAEAE